MGLYFKIAGLLLGGVVACSSCQQKGKGILSIDEMKVVLLHHTMTEEFLNGYITRDTSLRFDSVQHVLYRNVLRLHHLDSARFYRSLEYYKSDIERFRILLDSAYAYANREREKRYQVQEEIPVSVADSSGLSSSADSSAMPVEKDTTDFSAGNE
jgi:hypothetical protein